MNRKLVQWAEHHAESNNRRWIKAAELQEAWKLAGEKLGRAERRRSTPGDSLKVLGVIAAGIGAYFLIYVGANYSACQSLLVQAANPQLCRTADTAHQAGIILLIGGGVLFIAGYLSKSSEN